MLMQCCKLCCLKKWVAVGLRQVIIMLYLLEENTSYVILFSSFLGLIIEFWKLTQAMSVTIDMSRGIPRLRFKDKSSYTCASLFSLPTSFPFLDVCFVASGNRPRRPV